MAISDAVSGMMHDPEASAPPKKVHTMVITRVPGKGHHVTHHHTHPSHAAQAHMVQAPDGNEGNLDNLHDHLEEHMGGENPGEAACESGQCE
jgi:hypothetical protein